MPLNFAAAALAKQSASKAAVARDSSPRGHVSSCDNAQAEAARLNRATNTLRRQILGASIEQGQAEGTEEATPPPFEPIHTLHAKDFVDDSRPRDWSFWRLVGDFSGKDLKGIKLVGADLSGCNFAGADMRGVVCYGADLSAADCTRVDIRDANLCRANLCGTKFVHAKLDNVNLRFAVASPRCRSLFVLGGGQTPPSDATASSSAAASSSSSSTPSMRISAAGDQAAMAAFCGSSGRLAESLALEDEQDKLQRLKDALRRHKAVSAGAVIKLIKRPDAAAAAELAERAEAERAANATADDVAAARLVEWQQTFLSQGRTAKYVDELASFHGASLVSASLHYGAFSDAHMEAVDLGGANLTAGVSPAAVVGVE